MARNRRMSILIWQTKRPRGASLIFSRGERGKGFVSPQHMMPPDGLLLRNNSVDKSALLGGGVSDSPHVSSPEGSVWPTAKGDILSHLLHCLEAFGASGHQSEACNAQNSTLGCEQNAPLRDAHMGTVRNPPTSTSTELFWQRNARAGSCLAVGGERAPGTFLQKISEAGQVDLWSDPPPDIRPFGRWPPKMTPTRGALQPYSELSLLLNSHNARAISVINARFIVGARATQKCGSRNPPTRTVKKSLYASSLQKHECTTFPQSRGGGRAPIAPRGTL